MRKIPYRKIVYDLHIRIPSRFDQENKKKSVIYTLRSKKEAKEFLEAPGA